MTEQNEPELIFDKNSMDQAKEFMKFIKGPIVPLGIIILGLILIGTSSKFYKEVNAKQVAIKVNYWSGEQTIIQQPGIKFFLPVLEEVFVLDKTPIDFMMDGQKLQRSDHVSKLTVRANDGSNFGFDEITIKYELITSKADYILKDSGLGESFKGFWIKTAARSILRDEFGRLSIEDVTDPTKYNVALTETESRLNKTLEPHGIKVIQIVYPKPKFDPDYEKAIEARKVANQEVEALKAERKKLVNTKLTRIALVDTAKEIEKQNLLGTLNSAIVVANKDKMANSNRADAYNIQQNKAAAALLSATEIRAKALKTQYSNEIEGLRKEIQGYANQGMGLVWREYAKKLSNLTIDLVPYQIDPAPEKLEVKGLKVRK